MDDDSGLCRGCYRTLDEIACWGGLSETEREAVLGVLPERRAEARERAMAAHGFGPRPGARAGRR